MSFCLNLRILIIPMVLVLLSTTQILWAQEFVRLESPHDMVIESDVKEIDLWFKIQDGYYIQADQPTVEWVIPTRVTISSTLALGTVQFPSGYELPWPDTSGSMLVFKDQMRLKIPLLDTIEPGVYHLNGILYYQACDRVKCYFPRELAFEIRIEAIPINK